MTGREGHSVLGPAAVRRVSVLPSAASGSLCVQGSVPAPRAEKSVCLGSFKIFFKLAAHSKR